MPQVHRTSSPQGSIYNNPIKQLIVKLDEGAFRSMLQQAWGGKMDKTQDILAASSE